jgi:serine/threonine protein kinase
MTLAPGIRLGPYEIAAPIGAGGMGEVWKAKDTRLGREVAIKVLPPGFADDAERLRRFELEAKALAALNHPNVLAIFDVGTHEGSPYLVMELLEGQTLRERLHGGALPVKRAMELALQIARGLAAAHEKGLVHRDLKPANLFISRDGHLKILDFGLAKQADWLRGPQSEMPTQEARGLTSEGLVLGTVGYMSPEQVAGKPADARSDLFAFGLVLY